MSGIVGWITGKIKWLLLIAAIGGPVLAFFSWQDGEMIYVGAGAGAIGIVGSALFFLLGRRRSDSEEQAA